MPKTFDANNNTTAFHVMSGVLLTAQPQTKGGTNPFGDEVGRLLAARGLVAARACPPGAL
jgi:hypothetical protein